MYCIIYILLNFVQITTKLLILIFNFLKRRFIRMKERKLCKNTKKASEAPATIASKPKREKVTLCVVKPKILPNTYIEIQTRTW